MKLGAPYILDTSRSDWEEIRQPWYSKPFLRKVLRRDPSTGATDLLIRYPAGMVAPAHRHAFSHMIFVLDNELIINGEPHPSGTYAYFPAGQVMTHVSSAAHDCTFLICFEGPPDFIIVES